MPLSLDLISFIRQNRDDDIVNNLYEQLFHRKFYKSLWKNVFEFKAIVKDAAQQDSIIMKIGQYRKEEGGLEELERQIIENSEELDFGDFYIAIAKFKPFVPVANKAVYISINGERKRFNDIFQESIYKQPQQELPYIFVKDESIRDILLKKINSGQFL